MIRVNSGNPGYILDGYVLDGHVLDGHVLDGYVLDGHVLIRCAYIIEGN